ncbi:MAG TPA: histidine kinase [Bryobacteraceae bacterium]|nr:histidine kinase [Bryobacteraceae bacterium]
MIPDSESGSALRGAGNPLLLENVLNVQAGDIRRRAGVTLDAEARGLLSVQTRFVAHYFRLQNAERSLSQFMQARRPAVGISAVRQVEKERERLGRELHTGVGQLLVAIRLQLEVIATQLPAPPAPVQQALDRIGALANDAGEQVRALSRRLHPPEWQRLTLEAAIRQLWESSGVPQRFQATLTIEVLPREPEQEAKVLVYRATQEALTNLVRHARANRVEASLAERAGNVILRIGDNGVGFDTVALLNGPAKLTQGIGLRSIREQATSLGGQLRMESGANGTVLELSVPIELPKS